MIKDEWTRDLPKRFYGQVDIAEEGAGHTILLDGRTVRTPLKRALVVPTIALAEALAAEWDVQGEHIDTASMPVSKLANTSIDHAGDKTEAIVEEFVSYAGSDLVCYRAEAPEGLVQRQAQHWDPVLDWSAAAVGVRLRVTEGVVHVRQPDEALDVLRAHVAPYDRFRLTGLQTLTALTGSALLALSLAEDALAPDVAWSAANVDEDWQIELWGWDAEAERQRSSRHREFEAAGRFLRLLER
jgi:chaperone required for assembly of F1-ATPase